MVGSELVTHVATSFIREHPPSRTCAAEYGDEFPRYLGAHPAAESLPYLAQFAELEWHLGRLALATEESANVQYIHLDWALDELIGFYLTDTAPDAYALRQEEVWLEIRGLRGELQMNRLTGEEFARRVAPQPTGARDPDSPFSRSGDAHRDASTPGNDCRHPPSCTPTPTTSTWSGARSSCCCSRADQESSLSII